MAYEENNTSILNNPYLRLVFLFAGAIILALPFTSSAHPILIVLSLVIAVFIFASAKSIKQAAFNGAIFGFTFFSVQSFWVTYLNAYAQGWAYIGWLALSLIEMNAFVVFAIAVRVIHKKVDSWLISSLVISFVFVSIEIIRSIGLLGYPLGLVANVFVDFVPIAKVAALVGWPGISFLIIFVSSSVALAFYKKLQQKEILIAISVIIVILLLANQPGHKGVKEYQKVAILQTNTSIKDKKDPLKQKRNFKILKDLLLKVDSQAKKIIAPETVLPGYYPTNRPLLNELHSLTKADLIIGSLRQNGSSTYNTALGGNDFYNKNNLVLFGENVPFNFLFKYIKPLEASLTAGTEAKIINKTAVLICSESLDWLYARRAVNAKAKLIAIISNDAWFGKSSFAYQHLQSSRLRAIENGRYVLLASNAGYSAIIDANGQIKKRLNFNEQGTLTARITKKYNKTFFNLYGNWLNLVLLFLGPATFAIAIRKTT